MTELILVDENNLQIGTGEKIKIHKLGLLHRAFSIVIFNSEGEILVQRRAENKYHSAGLWANSCCGHPESGENDTKSSAKKRLFEELGFICELEEITRLSYNLSLDNGMYEHEYTHIFKGEYNKKITPNPIEVSEIRWERPSVLREEVFDKPETFATWFKLYLGKYYNKIFT